MYLYAFTKKGILVHNRNDRTMLCIDNTDNSSNVIYMMIINTFDINCPAGAEYDTDIITSNTPIRPTINEGKMATGRFLVEQNMEFEVHHMCKTCTVDDLDITRHTSPGGTVSWVLDVAALMRRVLVSSALGV
jgi:hypothetical protein